MMKNFLPEDFNKLQLSFFTGCVTAGEPPVSQGAAALNPVARWKPDKQNSVGLAAHGCWSAARLETVASPLRKETAPRAFATVSFHSLDESLVVFS